MIEHVRKHPGTVAVPDDQHVRCRRARRQIHDVRHTSRPFVRADDPHRLIGDRLLRLGRGRADMMGPVGAEGQQRRRELAARA